MLIVKKILSKQATIDKTPEEQPPLRSKHYILKGDPIPLARARHAYTHVYDSQKKEKLIGSIHIKKQHNQEPLFTGPLSLNITFYVPMPTSWSGKKKMELEETPVHVKPDLSNYIKFVEDIANGIIYTDDSLIASITSQKLYSYEPRTEFIISEIAHGKNL